MSKKRFPFHSDVMVGIFMFILGAAMFVMAFKFPITSRRFPFIATGLFMLFAVMVFIEGLKKTKALDENYKPPYGWKTVKYPLLMFLILCGYYVLLETITFFPATALFIIGIMLFCGVRSVKAIVIYVIVLNAFIWLLFIKQFNMVLP